MIGRDQAAELTGVLITSTTGWNDDSTEATIMLMEARWSNFDLACEAVASVTETWTRPSRPPWGGLMEAYRTAARRATETTPAIQATPENVPDIREGRRIAAEAYARECRNRRPDDPHIRSGFRTAEPNWRVFDALMGTDHHADEAR
jgi:hypothetical protein